jgi:hypothetical protein
MKERILNRPHLPVEQFINVLVTPNEVAWLDFLRLISKDTDPAITLARVQALQRLFRDVR